MLVKIFGRQLAIVHQVSPEVRAALAIFAVPELSKSLLPLPLLQTAGQQ